MAPTNILVPTVAPSEADLTEAADALDAPLPTAPPGRPRWGPVLAAVLLSLVWPLMWAGSQGTVDSLLGAGVDGPSYDAVRQDIPDLDALDAVGHDGQQFYVIARHPLTPQDARGDIDVPTYRYRRILFPLLAGAMVPGGGRLLIAAFFALSILGVVLAARSLQLMGGGPRWLPLVAALNPAVITSLTLSLSDALGTGLALAAIVAATRRRWAAAVAFAVLATLTRETFVIAAVAIAMAPGMPLRWRAASLGAPIAALGAWMLYVQHQLDGMSLLANSGDQLSLPFVGYLSPDVDGGSLFMAGLALVLLVSGAWVTRRRCLPVTVVLGLQAVLLLCVSPAVTFNWLNSVRTAAPLVPLALWAILSRDRGRAAPPSEATLVPVARTQ